MLVGNYDICFPRDVTTADRVPANFDWKHSSTRLDQLIEYVQDRYLPAKV
jgi:hypothetical protein